MGRESKTNTFSSSNLVTQCSIMQWFDYAVLFVIPAISSKSSIESVLQVKFKILEQNDSILFNVECFSSVFLIQELNGYLLQRSYLVGNNLTLADVVLFYSISDIMVCMRFLLQLMICFKKTNF